MPGSSREVDVEEVPRAGETAEDVHRRPAVRVERAEQPRRRAARDGHVVHDVREDVALHLGRLFTYSLLGASAGAIGGVAGYVGGLRTTQSALFILANVTLLVIGVYALRGTAGIPLLERAGGRLAQRVGTGPLLGRLFRSERFSGFSTPLAIGVVWGFVPCGLIYTVLALALLPLPS